MELAVLGAGVGAVVALVAWYRVTKLPRGKEGARTKRHHTRKDPVRDFSEAVKKHNFFCLS